LGNDYSQVNLICQHWNCVFVFTEELTFCWGYWWETKKMYIADCRLKQWKMVVYIHYMSAFLNYNIKTKYSVWDEIPLTTQWSVTVLISSRSPEIIGKIGENGKQDIHRCHITSISAKIMENKTRSRIVNCLLLRSTSSPSNKWKRHDAWVCVWWKQRVKDLCHSECVEPRLKGR
jgi:hypothetical protein